MNSIEENKHGNSADVESVSDEPCAPAVPTTFAVTDAASANWVVRKVVEARAYAERARRWADLEVRRAEREEQFFLRRFGVELEAWARGEIAKLADGRKSIRLPSGMLGFRTAPPSLVITDETKLMNWVEDHVRDAVEIRRLLLKSVVMNHIKTTGDCPIGAEIGGGDERFFIR